MLNVLLAGAGGFIGSALRYLAGVGLQQWAANARFPLATLTVNLIGCFVIGFLSHIAEVRGLFSAETRVFLFVGVLGGFTTFSSFGNETIDLWRGDREWFAVANVACHVTLGLSAVVVGRLLAHQMQ